MTITMHLHVVTLHTVIFWSTYLHICWRDRPASYCNNTRGFRSSRGKHPRPPVSPLALLV